MISRKEAIRIALSVAPSKNYKIDNTILRNKVFHDTYIKTNPKFLKQIYMNAMENVTINIEEQRQVMNEEYHIHVHVHMHEDGASYHI